MRLPRQERAMLPDDTYRTGYQATIRTLEAWLATQADVAEVEVARDPNCWRARVTPHAANACPFELALRVDQHYDLSVGAEVYEDQPIDSLALFPELLAAIAAGRVISRRLATAATGTVQAIETIVTPGDGLEWSGRRTLAAGPALSPVNDADMVATDRHYVAYSRAA
jgi:hypothetical protein